MTPHPLKIASDFALPLHITTDSLALLGKRGSGKSFTASVLVEEMLKAKLQVVVLDPMHAWWGLRSSADGRGEGFPVAILGGPRGDVPLEPTGGTLVAELVVDERLSAILDLSPFSKTDRRRFVADFLERLFQRNRDAMHVVLEEADLFAPEGKLKRAGDEAMLGAVYDLVRRGRGRGIGSTLITQRSASLSKEVLTQAEILFALRTTGPQDVAAIREWIRYHGSDEERELVLGSLHELPTGEAFAWWPVEGILKRIKVRERETFDSCATPKPGQAKREPKTIADVDLAALSERMASTIEKAKAEDPRELRGRIAELQRELARAKPQAEVETRVATVVERVEVPVFNGELEQLEQAIARMDELAAPIVDVGKAIRDAAGAVAQAIVSARIPDTTGRAGTREREVVPAGSASSRQRPAVTPRKPATSSRAAARPGIASRSEVAASLAARDVALKGPQQRVLDALAWLEAVGFSPATKLQTGFIAGYRVGKRVGGTYGNILGELRSSGLIEYPGTVGHVELTGAGRALARSPDIEPTTRGLQEAIFARLDGPERRVLQVLVEAYPSHLSKQDTGEAAGYTVGDRVGGTFGNILGRLRSLGLIDYPTPGHAIALPVLFLEEAYA